jgi:2-(1,2-epoxy-1,2-dihydrophenyl)acetyl-CoA isomerase
MNRAFESDRHTVLAQEAMALVLCRESGFFKESAQRFLDKQPPLFQWPDRPGHARKTR